MKNGDSTFARLRLLVRLSRFPLLASLGFFSMVADAQFIPLYCPQGYYPLLCRGPLVVRTTGDFGCPGCIYEIVYTPNPTAAITNGQSLRKGSCAWSDRPLSSLEAQQTLEFNTYNYSVASQTYPLFHMVNQCASNSSCVVVFCARASAGELPGLDVLNDYGATEYPFP